MNRTEVFEEDNVTIFLEWAAENATGVIYNVSIIPRVPIIKLSDTSIELRVAYNTAYNLSIFATLCGRNSANTVLKIYSGTSLCPHQ